MPHHVHKATRPHVEVPHAGGERSHLEYYRNFGCPLNQIMMQPALSPVAMWLVDNPLLLKSRVDPAFPLSYWRHVTDAPEEAAKTSETGDADDRELNLIRRSERQARFPLKVIKHKKHEQRWLQELELEKKEAEGGEGEGNDEEGGRLWGDKDEGKKKQRNTVQVGDKLTATSDIKLTLCFFIA